MIKSFRHRGLRRLYERGDASKLPPDMVEKIETILAALEVATAPKDLDRPSFRLHPLKGERKGEWAVTVRANWRIIFRLEGGDAHDVEFIDYH